MNDAPAVYDLKGLKCPLPVLRTKRRLADMEKGDVLQIETTDPLAVIDIPHFCQENGHPLLDAAKTSSGHRFIIRKG
ncbi:MAG: sulfurtransferase TusA family protein [Allorhizobium sp.]